MNPIESRMLSVLRPGEMIRFILRPNTGRGIEFEIEGAAADGGPGLLVERIELLLAAMRDRGYLFSPVAETGGEKRRAAGRRCNGATEKTAPRWVRIQPRSTVVSLRDGSGLGFDAGSKRHQRTGTEIRIPDFPVSLEPSLFECPASLIADRPEIEALEIDIIRWDLPQGCVETLGRALEAHEVAARAGDCGLSDVPSVSQLFLALWLSERSGWQIRSRALLRPRWKKIPTGILELIGRDIFGCECEVSALEGGGEACAGGIDLSSSFPKGWSLPAILPSPRLFDALAADRLHNIRLPQLPNNGQVIGLAEGEEVRMPAETRDRHTYIVGATGTGKSTLLLRLIRHDLEAGESVVLLDPHGDLYQDVLGAIPDHRKADVITIDPTSILPPLGLNVLDFPQDLFFRRRAEILVGELIRFFQENWNCPEAFGPMFEIYFRNTLLLMIYQQAETLTLLDFERVLTEKKFRGQLLVSCPEVSVRRFWTDIAEKAGGEAALANVVPYITSKVSPLTQGAFLSQLFGKEKDEVRLDERMNGNGIVLVNLNKGCLGPAESRLLGTLLTMQIFAAGLKRSLLPPDRRSPVNVYIDEFQNFVSDNAASMLSEARKFGLRMHLANQTLAQLKGGHGRQDLLETVLGNVGNMILFRLGVPDAERLSLFLEPFTRHQMQELPNYHALARILTPEGPVPPVVMRTLAA